VGDEGAEDITRLIGFSTAAILAQTGSKYEEWRLMGCYAVWLL
jgi:hypothetical protein